ncbi:MAG: CcmD family protein [Melioribacteraceae bacterium]|nr:CcmD family protein [Melioribacteraceae bacterium]WKZ70233.1 MAG: CcmD family protein [Melioribacteraceae bacterium]
MNLEGLYDFLNNNSIYIVLFIVLVVWLGIFTFLWNTDKRLKKIEEELKIEGSKQNEK